MKIIGRFTRILIFLNRSANLSIALALFSWFGFNVSTGGTANEEEDRRLTQESFLRMRSRPQRHLSSSSSVETCVKKVVEQLANELDSLDGPPSTNVISDLYNNFKAMSFENCYLSNCLADSTLKAFNDCRESKGELSTAWDKIQLLGLHAGIIKMED
ncbi:hypothetical protein QYF36_013944 [Acer negundo]|nr:hypothetical protein QYF36_013944 [Acer negundo]